VAESIKENTRMIFCETPSNPLVKVVDIEYLRRQADRVGAILVVDNTFATPYHQLPLELGADLIVHSATKGLGGHNDLMAGAIACSTKQYYDELWFTRQAIGTTLDAFSASLLERGLKTFEIRAAKMSENAMAIAEFLADHPKITRICYPGLPDDPGYKIACRQMKKGFGGVLAFDVGKTQDEAKKFVEKLNVIYHAVSLGCTETLVCLPVLTTMLYLPVERRTIFGVRPNTVRLSAGIGDTNELIEDLKQALE
jgi:cystathionine beta-lyase/cystathionine gamma-synthase